MTARQRLKLIVSTALFLLLMTSCGKKGDLFLPENNTPVSSAQEQAQQQGKDKKQPKQSEN